MANLLESSQQQQTIAPDFYTNYLSNLAGKGTTAATGAQYVGAQPLQEKAFQDVGNLPSTYQPTLQAARSTLGAAGDVTSPLGAATPYLQTAGRDPSQLASQYMSPYITNVVNALGDAGQRNIQQNLAPRATAGAVGSGQFGSQRGAQVLGQTISNADRDILNQQYQALNTGYGQALQAGTAQNQLMGQLGSTAGQLASSGQQNLTQLGNAQSQLAGQNQALGLGNINALSTLGGQQQTIAQNQQLFPLTNLSTLSGMLRGYNIPTTTKTTMQASPLSVIGGAITGTANLFTPRYDASGKEIPNSIPFKQITSGLGNAYDYLKDTLKGTSSPVTPGNTGGVGNGGEGFSIIPDGYGGYTDTSGNPVDQYGMPIAAVPPSRSDTNIDETQGP
jgi:hypothetical protein